MPSSRILTLAEATVRCAKAREAGERVALCNGVFDLLHVGHVRYLEAAKAMADRLVVAVNSDRSTRGNRGPGRPVVPAAERAELLAGLRAVDWVVIFDEPTVAAVIAALKPDLQVKGTDYTPESVPERAAVEAVGGRVVIAGDPKDHSVTQMLDRLKPPGES
jgi:D-glycero-beta-D-manno-heptose 1-phosphate adenylyltransferase